MTITSTICETCGGAFEYERRRQPRRFCSKSCRQKMLAVRHAAYKKAWAMKNKDSLAEKRAAWLTENRAVLKAAQRRYYEKNREKVIAKARQCDIENPASARERKARYAATPRGRDKALESVHRRRARMAGARGSHTRAQFRKLVAFYENKCLCCGDVFPIAQIEADHVVPVAHGGDNSIFNLQPLCQPCNRRKADKHQDFRPTWENYL